MSTSIEVKVPAIGDFKNIPVIEVLVKPGDVVKREDPLVTLESDKATLDVPAPLPPHMERTFKLFGFDVKQYDPIEDAPEYDPSVELNAAIVQE